MSTAKRPLIDFADLASGGTPSKSNSDYWGGAHSLANAKGHGPFQWRNCGHS